MACFKLDKNKIGEVFTACTSGKACRPTEMMIKACYRQDANYSALKERERTSGSNSSDSA